MTVEQTCFLRSCYTLVVGIPGGLYDKCVGRMVKSGRDGRVVQLKEPRAAGGAVCTKPHPSQFLEQRRLTPPTTYLSANISHLLLPAPPLSVCSSFTPAPAAAIQLCNCLSISYCLLHRKIV